MSQSENPEPQRQQPASASKPTNIERSPEAEVLPPPVQDALRESGLDPGAPNVRRFVSIMTSMYAGPIPPAEMLAKYEEVRPGLSATIINWAEQQRNHRMAL